MTDQVRRSETSPMRQFCERYFPERHRNRRCACPMPPDPFLALVKGEITSEAYVRDLRKRVAEKRR